ncbi:MAG: DedA family protein [Arenicellales bacterium]
MHLLVEFVNTLLGWLLAFVHDTVDLLGYTGVVLMMAIESCNIPLPSEVIMPYAGYFVQRGMMNFHLAAWAGAFGCVLGSVPSYWLGWYGGRPFLEKHGRWLLLTHHDLDAADRWVQRYGDWAFFICRMLPVVRTFISLPAGVLKARFWPFVIFTFIGSLVWCYALVWVGVVFGGNLEAFQHYWHKFEVVIALAILALAGWYVWRHVSHFRRHRRSFD